MASGSTTTATAMPSSPAESFAGEQHLELVFDEGQDLITAAVKA